VLSLRQSSSLQLEKLLKGALHRPHLTFDKFEATNISIPHWASSATDSSTLVDLLLRGPLKVQVWPPCLHRLHGGFSLPARSVPLPPIRLACSFHAVD
jgi:hypothetical protein